MFPELLSCCRASAMPCQLLQCPPLAAVLALDQRS